MRTASVVAIALAFVALPAGVPASDALPPDVEAGARIAVAPLTVQQAQATVAKFQAAVRAGDARQVAALARFPLPVNGGATGTRTIRDARAFVREFDQLLDAATRARIVDQEFATMPVGYRGLMFDDGRLWLQATCLKTRRDGGCRDADYALRLVTINLPAEASPR